MALEKADLLLGENHRVSLRVLLQAHQTLVTGLDVVAEPNTANTARTDFSARQA